MDNLLVYGTPAWKRPQVRYPDISDMPIWLRQPLCAPAAAEVQRGLAVVSRIIRACEHCGGTRGI